MKIFDKDLENDPVIVAEIGVNHEGCLKKACALVESAASAGADAVKFQTYTPSRYASSTDPDRLSRVTKFSLEISEFKVLADLARSLNIGFFSTPITEDVVSDLNEFIDVFKIASGDLTFEPVIRAVARTEKPFLLSTGLGTLPEIDQAVSWVSEEIGQAKLRDRLVIMHCVVAYPTPIDEANVRSVPFLADRYNVFAGFSSHVIGIEPSLAAIANGASVIEVHFTDDKYGREFRDHELSLDESDLRRLVKAAPIIKASLGNPGKQRHPSELPLLELARKGVVASKNLKAGVVLVDEDLMFARPATEFPACDVEKVIGRRLLVDLKRGELIPRSGLA
jgi:N-acetylneuraminate synthase/N,N'-diacetyllegionaminate synthase